MINPERAFAPESHANASLRYFSCHSSLISESPKKYKC
nr:MAG TPA: hypothetical protein [Caudoviricetes sp.]